jgi:hypothetical protein
MSILPTHTRGMNQLLLRWHALTERWQALTFYQRFESMIALVLTSIIILVTLVALYRLLVEVINGLILGALNPLDHTVFQTIFG